nr:hypothetical protein [Halobaculum salinum]
MGSAIAPIESTEFRYPIEDVGTDGNGFNLMYDPGRRPSGSRSR